MLKLMCFLVNFLSWAFENIMQKRLDDTMSASQLIGDALSFFT